MKLFTVAVTLLALAVVLTALPLDVDAQAYTRGDSSYSYPTDMKSIKAEANQLGIPESQHMYFKTRLRTLNKRYQAGGMTKTQYIQSKRNLVSRCE